MTWAQRSRRRIFLDSHTPDFNDPHQRGLAPAEVAPLILSDVDPEAQLGMMADCGADSVVFFAKCQYGNSYYPTQVGHQHSQLRGRDLFGEMVAAANRHRMGTLAYFSNMWDVVAAANHPDWRLVPLPGTAGRWPALCLLSGYRHYAHNQVREIARRYPIDGLWTDILTAGPCICERCDAAFRREYGRAMPRVAGGEGWLDLIHFSQNVVQSYLQEQRVILRAERPEAAFVPNFYATTFAEPAAGLTTAHLELADIGSSEGYSDWHGLGFPSFAASYIEAGVLGKPTEVLLGRSVHTWDFTLRSEAQLRFEGFSVAAHGSCVTFDDQPYATGALEPEVYRRLGPVYARIRDREPYLLDAKPIRYSAILVSQRLRELESLIGTSERPSIGDASARFPPSHRRHSESDLIAAVTGTYRALAESHLPVSFVDDRPGSLAELGQYKVLVLADALSLSEMEVQAVTEFVHSGGGVLITGAAGVLNATGDRAASQGLIALTGVAYSRPDNPTYPYVRVIDPALRDVLGAVPLPHYGPIPPLQVLADDVTVIAVRVDPVLETDDVTFWHNNQPAPGRVTEQPVIVERKFGQGLVITCAARLGNNHARLGHGTYRDLLAELVLRAARAQPPVRMSRSHRSTELVLTTVGTELVVHLVTGAAMPRLSLPGVEQPAAIEDVASVASIVLRTLTPMTSARRLSGDSARPLEVASDKLSVTIRDLDDWETVILSL